MNETSVVLSGDLSMGRIHQVLSSLEPVWDPFAQPCCVHFDLQDVIFIWPSVITLLTAAAIRLRQEGFSIRITQPDAENADAYLNRIDFYKLVGMDVAYPWRRHSADGRFREVVQVQSEDEGDEVVGEVMRILDRNVEGISGIYDAALHAFLEIVNNVFHHAQSPTHAIICAQSYPWLRCVELAVVDTGRGIAASLGQNPELAGRFTSAAEAIELAVQPRVTGRPEHNSGEGLFFSLEFVKANRGQACVYSQDGALWLRGARMVAQPGPFWPGTWVSLRFRTDCPVDTGAIFSQYAPSESDYDWLF
jgi:hypothetical protein